MPFFGEAPFMIYSFGQEAYFRRHLFPCMLLIIATVIFMEEQD